MVAIVCIKWGTSYPADDVNILYQGVKDHISGPFRFLCLTDNAAGLREEVEVLDLPATGGLSLRWRGCWPKLAMFKRGVLDGVDLALYLDLDVVIVGSLDPIVDHARDNAGLHILREWNPTIWNLVPLSWRPDRGGQSSMVAWRPGEQDHLFDNVVADPEPAYRQWRNDQRYIRQKARDGHYFPPDFCISFRRHCVWHYPLNLIFRTVKKPEGPAVVVFHGRPKPSDLTRDDQSRWGTKYRYGFGPVDWVKAYWRRGLDAAKKVRPPADLDDQGRARHISS